MKVELLYFDGCPGYRKVERNLRDVFEREGIKEEARMIPVNTDREAEELRFPGSPTVRIGGRDLFPSEQRSSYSLRCRVYATPEGLRDHPTREMIRAALWAIRHPHC